MEVESLTAREDGGRKFFDIGGGEDEFDESGRFFECFEESVEGGGGEHMDFIEDDDSESALGLVLYIVDEFTDVVDAVVASGVHFEDVEESFFVNIFAGVACEARRGGGRLVLLIFSCAVEAFCEDSRGGSFPGTSDAREEEGMSESSTFEGV